VLVWSILSSTALTALASLADSFPEATSLLICVSSAARMSVLLVEVDELVAVVVSDEVAALVWEVAPVSEVVAVAAVWPC
jgi:hypothetical protein